MLNIVCKEGEIEREREKEETNIAFIKFKRNASMVKLSDQIVKNKYIFKKKKILERKRLIFQQL